MLTFQVTAQNRVVLELLIIALASLVVLLLERPDARPTSAGSQSQTSSRRKVLAHQ